jgi:hypothetical protein
MMQTAIRVQQFPTDSVSCLFIGHPAEKVVEFIQCRTTFRRFFLAGFTWGGLHVLRAAGKGTSFAARGVGLAVA